MNMTHEQLVERIRTLQKESGLAQVKIAQQVGVSESTFSLWLKGKYANEDTIDAKVREYLQKNEQREEICKVSDLEFVQTEVARRVGNVLEYCRLQRTMGVVYGDAGVGKTRTIEHWKRGKSDVHVVTACPAFSSPKPFLKLLARELKTSLSGGVDDMFLDILDKLSGSDKTIVVDEAQHLNRKTLEMVRSINDMTQVAVVLVGNELVYSKLTGKQEAEFAQLFTRLSMRNHVRSELFTRGDIEEIFGEIAGDALDYLLKVSRSRYALRGAIHLYLNALNNEKVSLDGLRAMATVMGIAV